MEGRIQNGLAGLRVLALESRRAGEMAKLIASYGGEPVVAPAMQEVPLESNAKALEFVRRLVAGGFDMVIFLPARAPGRWQKWRKRKSPKGNSLPHSDEWP